MEDLRRCLVRQEQETNERSRGRAERQRLQREEDEQVVIAVALLDEENQGRCRSSQVGRGPNVDRHRHCQAVIRMLTYSSSADQVDEIARIWKSTTLEALNCPTTWQGDYANRKCQKSIILEVVAGFDTWVWHAFFGVARSQNYLNMLGQSPIFNDVLRGQGPNITYQVNNTVYQTGYYLADDIYLRWTTFVKSILNPRSHKQKLFASYQEGYRKNVERCFGILQARWLIIRGVAHMFDEDVLRSIMMTCIILHNMIVEDEYDYDTAEVYEPDPMNMALTRIYERPMGPSGEPFEPNPLVRDGRFMTHMVYRYTEMQSSYIHEMRQLDLMEHLWVVKGNDGE
ncbi:unnamed protein product [Prunus armeniaca]